MSQSFFLLAPYITKKAHDVVSWANVEVCKQAVFVVNLNYKNILRLFGDYFLLFGQHLLKDACEGLLVSNRCSFGRG